LTESRSGTAEELQHRDNSEIATGEYLGDAAHQWLPDAEGANGVFGDPLSGEDPVGWPGGM